jgi:Rad3-related DNA helicase
MRNIATGHPLSALDKSDINTYWPFATNPPRDTQLIIQEWIKEQDPKIKYFLLEIPVGGGKSPIALNLSGWFSQSQGDSYILTPQKILQKQYEDSFIEDLRHSLYGKNNYSCTSKGTNCEVGSSLKPRCANCPHKAALSQCKSAHNIILNYTLALNLFKWMYGMEGSPINHRKTLVFDEAHQLESFLTEFNSVEITEHRCKRLKIPFLTPKDTKEAMNWIRDKYVPALKSKIVADEQEVENISNEMEFNPGAKISLDQVEMIKNHDEHKKQLAEIEGNLLGETDASINSRYVLVTDKGKSFKFREVYGRNVFKTLCEPVADRFIFMSSTILDKDAFCSDLGIDPALTAFISMPSEFPEENRPVCYLPTARMTYGWDSQERDRVMDRKNMIAKIKEILKNIHEEEHGVIHTGSFQVAKWLVEELEGKIPHRIYHHNPGSDMKRDDVIADFQEDRFTGSKLLISPSVTEGLDLKDDKGRFAIFTKVPYPFLGDAWVKRRQTLSDRWYTIEALKAIIQGGGRVVRGPEDFGEVYILDTSWEGLYRRGEKFIPQWWKDAYLVP